MKWGGDKMNETVISRATLGRIPIYLEYLKGLSREKETISATAVARDLGLGEVQVRKDLGALCRAGRPKIGYITAELISCLEGYFETERVGAVLIGGSHFSRALLDFSGFEDLGFDLMAAFDKKITAKETSERGKPVLPIDSLSDFCSSRNVALGIIDLPPESAQSACDMLYKNNIKAIWCISPCRLTVPSDVIVEYENMVASSAYLKMQIDMRRTK